MTRLPSTSPARQRRSARAAAVALLSAILLVPVAVAAQPREEPLRLDARARQHLQRGARLYEEQRYDEAMSEFHAGYALDPRPEFLYALGQAARAKGDCESARRYLTAFIRTSPPERQVAAARVQITRCEYERLRAGPRPAPREGLVAAPPGPSSRRPERPPPGADLAIRRPSRAPWLRLAATPLFEARSGQVGAELGVSRPLLSWVDVGAAAVLGSSVGARVGVRVHPDRRRAGRLQPEMELRGLVHPVADSVCLGGGLWLGASLELGPGRLRAGGAGELFSAPPGYYPYAILVGAGYEIDL